MYNNNTTRIVAAVVDTSQLTLYREDGTTIIIPQGDSRLRRILNAATPQLVSQGWADVVIESTAENSYAHFEDQSNGVVKFFRIAKEKLKHLLALGIAETPPYPDEVPVAEQVIGSIPVSPKVEQAAQAAASAMNAVNEIISHAIPVKSVEFSEATVAKQGNVVEDSGQTDKQRDQEDTATDTIIAVVDNKVIPGMEKIKTQFGRAAKLGSTTGVENFLKRLGSVIEQRSHSVEDLLKFMERADTPIADDGSIIIYKVLNLSGKGKGHYVDCHTSKVEQFIGAYVCMDPSLVDHVRNNECSNGLHVARRGYIREFGGSVCVLAKLAPEDVITVPSYDANKMRVCGYHIIAELTPQQYALVKANKPITDDAEGKVLLGEAIAGKHIGRTHEVRITGQRGAGVQTTELDKAPPPKVVNPPVPVEAMDNPSKETLDTDVDPKAVVQQVEQVSRKDQARKLYGDWANGIDGAEAALRAFKKAAKVGWEKLGIPTDKDGQPTIKGVKKPVKVNQTTAAAVHSIAEAGRKAKPAVTTPSRMVNGVELGEGSYRDRIQKLLAIGITSSGVAKAILTLKQQSKKSWTTLGVSEAQVASILILTEKE